MKKRVKERDLERTWTNRLSERERVGERETVTERERMRERV